MPLHQQERKTLRDWNMQKPRPQRPARRLAQDRDSKNQHKFRILSSDHERISIWIKTLTSISTKNRTELNQPDHTFRQSQLRPVDCHQDLEEANLTEWTKDNLLVLQDEKNKKDERTNYQLIYTNDQSLLL